jgi:hypothetical protein
MIGLAKIPVLGVARIKRRKQDFGSRVPAFRKSDETRGSLGLLISGRSRARLFSCNSGGLARLFALPCRPSIELVVCCPKFLSCKLDLPMIVKLN